MLDMALPPKPCPETATGASYRPASGLPPVRGNRTHLTQVLVNISLNALDAMPEGGRLRIATGRRGEEVWVRLADNGPGLAKDVREHIFEPFFTTKEPGKGTGLGLSLAYETVRRHGGTIEIAGAPERGAAFTVRLPRLHDSSRPIPHAMA